MAKVHLHIETKMIERSPEHRATSCTGKIRYRKRGTAKQAAIKFIKEKGVTAPMSIYPCWFCNGWHVGNSTRTILARLQVVAPA